MREMRYGNRAYGVRPTWIARNGIDDLGIGEPGVQAAAAADARCEQMILRLVAVVQDRAAPR